MTFPEALDAYANALVIAAVEGGGRQDPAVVDRKADAAKRQLLKLYKAAAKGETPAVRALKQHARELQRRLARARKILEAQ